MNRIALIILVLAVIGAGAYFLSTRLVSKEGDVLGTTPKGPTDYVDAEATVLQASGNKINIRIDKILSYDRFPQASWPELKEGDQVLVLNTFKEDIIPKTPPGLKIGTTVRPGETPPPPPPITNPPVLEPEVGVKYQISLILCLPDITSINCDFWGEPGFSGWGASFYELGIVQYP